MRYLEIKKTEDICVLDIYDKTNKNTYKNIISMNGLDPDNTKVIYGFFLQQIFNCQLLEQSLFNSLIEKIANNVRHNVSD